MPDTAKRPDRAEIAKRVERAEKYLQKGKTPDALAEFLAILNEDPENDGVRQMAADLCLSLNRTSEAVKLLSQLYDRQLASSDASRASLTYKRLARLVNPTWEQKMRFAQLVEQSNKKLALETYEAAFAEVTKLGRKQESLSIVKRIVELDPNQANLVRLGELCSQMADHKGAAGAFARIAQIQESEGKNAGPWHERAYTEDASDPAIALSYGKNLLSDRQVGAAIFVLEPQILAGNAPEDLREAYGRALLAANRLVDAEPIIWGIFEQHPVRIQQVLELIGSMIDSELDKEAIALARKLEQFQRRRGERKSFINQLQEISVKHRACPEVLEFLSELFNSSNKESDYALTLLKLFDLYCSTGNYQKAGECLDRAAEVDPYEPGHQKRLEMLHGRIDENRFQVIASRFTSATKTEQQPSRSEEVTLGTAALQDLMLQAEILVQYGMKSKAIERLQRIQELFPHEEDRNEDLQRLYIAAGMTPKYAGSTPALPANAPSKSPSAPLPTAPMAPANDAGDVSSLTKVAEITRKLYKQSAANNVLTTAVNEIGAHWKTTRCVAAMRKPGLPPTVVQEYAADGVKAIESGSMSKLVALLHDVVINRGTITISDALSAAELQPIGPVIAEQITIALNNAGLRRLVKNLSVTDESSGLLNRASYLDLLQAEIRRGMQQATPLTVMLMKFGKHLSKESGDKGTDSIMQQIGKMIAANIRQNDLAFRYEATTVAVVLGETGEKESMLAVEKLRKLLGAVQATGKDQPDSFAAGLAQAVMKQQYDPVDIVTELINRVEEALASAVNGPDKVVALAPAHAAAAVA